MNRRRDAAERFAERRRREDEAPRLRDVAPDLIACRLELSQRRPGVSTTEIAHTRFLVVSRAPSLVFVPCADEACRNGGHDITSTLMQGFADRKVRIAGEHICPGAVKTEPCGRILAFIATAEYRRKS